MKNSRDLHLHLSTYRYEFLLIALLLLIFDKIFFPDNNTYIRYVWPLNMVIIALASFGIFHNSSKNVLMMRNVLSFVSICMPFMFISMNSQLWFMYFLTIFYILFYTFIFGEVMRQITLTKEVQLNVVIGSFCGYLLLSMMVVFGFILTELLQPNSFHGLGNDLASNYNLLVYFSFITLTSIGFGDIYPITDSSRLTVAFFGMLGQFYMVAVVGIIISKFTSKN
jgi:voltage-gated potassium channel